MPKIEKKLPEKPFKHIAVHQSPVGTQHKNKVKVQDGTTKKVSWRSGSHGFQRDFDGEPTSVNYANRDMAISHRVRMGSKTKSNGKAPKGGDMPDLPEE